MSLVKVQLKEIVKKQYLYKLNAYRNIITSLIITQLIALFFSINGVGNSGFGTSTVDVNIHVSYYSADIVLIFTLLWAFITGITITTKDYRNQEFSFVSNRLSSILSNILFLLTISMVAGLMAVFSRYILQDILYLFFDEAIIHSVSYGFGDYLKGLMATILYIVLISSFAYVLGMLFQIHKLFILVIPILFLGISFTNDNLLQNLFSVFINETFFSLFAIKVIVSSSLFFYCSYLINNRLEVRK